MVVDLAELLSLPGVEEVCVLRSAVGILALHGGSQDRGTHEIAAQAARSAGASYYAIVQPPNLRSHLTSRRHDPNQSQILPTFLRHIEIAISVHGFGRDGFVLYVDQFRGVVIEPYGPPRLSNQSGPLRGIIIGGLNPRLLEVARELFDGLIADFHVADERVRLGFAPDNPVNLPRRHGVQIELPPGLRGIGDFGERLTPLQDEKVDEVVAALIQLAERADGLRLEPLA